VGSPKEGGSYVNRLRNCAGRNKEKNRHLKAQKERSDQKGEFCLAMLFGAWGEGAIPSSKESFKGDKIGREEEGLQ